MFTDAELFDFSISFRRMLDTDAVSEYLGLLERIFGNIVTKAANDEKYRHVKARKIPDHLVDILLAAKFRQTVRQFGKRGLVI